MKLIIEMDLGETQKALTAGALLTLCDSLGDESLARQQLKETVNNKKPSHTSSKPVEFVKEDPEEPTGERGQGQIFTELTAKESAGDGCPFEKGTPAAEETGDESEVTVENVRAVLSVLSKAGKQAEMKAIFAKVGATKLSDVDPADYAKVLKHAKKTQTELGLA